MATYQEIVDTLKAMLDDQWTFSNTDNRISRVFSLIKMLDLIEYALYSCLSDSVCLLEGEELKRFVNTLYWLDHAEHGRNELESVAAETNVLIHDLIDTFDVIIPCLLCENNINYVIVPPQTTYGFYGKVREAERYCDSCHIKKPLLVVRDMLKRRNFVSAFELIDAWNSLTPSNAKGYVYLVQSPTTYYKIGRTTNPENRIKTFSVKLPFEVDYVCLIKTDDMILLERRLHAVFADKRGDGEWFQLSEEDVALIQQFEDKRNRAFACIGGLL